MISPECAPYSKVGGLADMVSSLSKEFAANGHEVKVFTPLHSTMKRPAKLKQTLGFMGVHMGLGIEEYCCVWETPLGKATAHFLEFNKYFDRASIYENNDNDARFTFMSKAALDFCRSINWQPDIIHCHDWTTGFVPAYLNTTLKHTPIGRAASIFTIHNMQHQGVVNSGILNYAGLPFSEICRADNYESYGAINMLKGAIYNSTKFTTVSPTYAKEIQTSAYGCGLDGIVRFKSADLVGILNGVDLDEWNPKTDKFIPQNFTNKDISGKAVCKQALQKRMGLEVNANIPLFGVIARLFDQKGLDLLAHITHPLFENMKIQIALLGSGERWLEGAFNNLSNTLRGKFAVHIGYDNALSHLIESGSDFFIMPSRFEPCGLNQMYSMAYGTLPIVRSTGGLADSVEQYDQNTGKGTGFLFNDATCEALYNTMGWACATWYDRQGDISKLRQNAMQKDFSWKQSAKKYMEVYDWAIKERAKAL